MALSLDTVWEVRDDGAADNGGGHVGGSSGTDRTQQAAAAVTYADLVIGASNTLTSAAFPFDSTHVGAIINITGGVNFTTGRYQVLAVVGGAATMDRSPGTLASTGGTGKLGGAITWATLASVMAASHAAHVRGGSYTVTATSTFSANVASPLAGGYYSRITGYGTVRGDGGRPVLTTSGSSITTLSFSGTGWMVANLEIDCASQTGSVGILYSAGGPFALDNVKVSNAVSYGIRVNATNNAVGTNIEVTGCASGATAALASIANSCLFENCYIHDNACPGIACTTHVVILDCVIVDNSGASSDGIYTNANTWHIIRNNTIHNNGRDGIRRDTAAGAFLGTIKNNLITSNGGYGIRYTTTTAAPAQPYFDGNAFWNNTSGARSNMDSTAGVYGVGAYTNADDVTLTGDPYTDAAGGDYSLNSTAGAGAACRGAGVPDDWPGLTPTGSPDFGALQVAHSVGGGGVPLIGGGLVR